MSDEQKGPADRLDPDDLVDVELISQRLGVNGPAVHKWSMRPDFPAPLFPRPGRVVAGKARIWAWPDVLGWIRSTDYEFRSERAKQLQRALDDHDE